ncbi:hypothetical protein F2Q69_00035297 [Brassica cretica]|uniref:Uncharacterized protein n=1 Tax=Brassica cretica TaxID=69181 RepID=A0A8S9SN73_BRACR|nr:hypothetical protein F2Q69_00035297 [Brassica cretica]
MILRKSHSTTNIQGPLLGRRPMDADLCPIFDEEDDHLDDDLGPTFDEKALSVTSIIMENQLCFDPGTTPTPLSADIEEHYEKLDLIDSLPEMFVKISSQDVKRFGFDKVKEFRVSNSIFENMINSFQVFELDKLSDQKRFQNGNNIHSDLVLSFDQFLKHSKGFDHLEKLKRVLHVQGKETLISYLNKYMSCTYDPSILVSALIVHDKHVQSPRSVRNISIGRVYQSGIWRCMYSRKMTSKLQGTEMRVDKLDELSELSDTTLELDELSDTTLELDDSKQTSLFRWTCASYQETDRNPSFVGLVRHIKQQPKSGVSPGTWAFPPFRANPVDGFPSKSCPNGLATIRSFCRVPELVEFHLPEAGEVAGSPPEGYFTCYEAYLIQCHQWFPIPEVIVRLFDRFKLSVSQINPCGLQHIVGILVLSYELGMTLDVDHLEAMLKPWGNSAIVQLRPRPNMTIITEFVSNNHDWKEHFFFVRVNDASVEENDIPIFRTRRGRKGIPDRVSASFDFDDVRSYVLVFHFADTNPLPPNLEVLRIARDLLRGGPSFWPMFTPKRVRRAVTLHHSRFQPDLPVEEGSESSMDGFVMCEVRARTEKSRSRKDKHVIIDDDVADGQCFLGNILRNYLNSEAGGSGGEQINLDGLLDFDFPPAEGGSSEVPKFTKTSRMALLIMNRALDASNQEACKAQFRAEMADKEIARLKDELECSFRRERGSAQTEVRRAYRRGKRERCLKLCKTVVTGSRASLGSLRGVIRFPDMERIWLQWDLIPVSPDMVEAETGAPDETVEVNQTTAPLDVNDYSIGRSMTGRRNILSGSRIFLISCLETLETSGLGLGQDLGLITTLGDAMTTSTYVSYIVFDLILSRFTVRDMFSAYVTCIVGIEHLSGDNF